LETIVASPEIFSPIISTFVVLAIAGTAKDFLLSLHVLKCYLSQNKEITDNLDIIIKQYYYVTHDEIEKRATEIFEEINSESPDIVGFSCMVWNMDVVKKISNKLKEKNPKIVVTFGGPEITREDIILNKFDSINVDFLLFGEAEKPFMSLTEFLIGQEKNLSEIRGLAYKKKGKFICHDLPDVVSEFEKLPSPYLNGFISDEILARPNIRVNIETQRGCNFRCAYCFYHKNFSLQGNKQAGFL